MAETLNDSSADPARCVLRTRGSTQLQLKVYYPFENRRRSKFSMDLMFVVPRQVSVSADEEGRRELLENTRSDTRFTVASVLLSDLSDPAFVDSPLNRIRSELDERGGRSRIDHRRIEYEIRMFCSLFAVQTKRAIAMIRELVDDPVHREEALMTTRHVIRDARRALAAFRSLRELLVDPGVPESVRTTHVLADEYAGDQFVRRLLDVATFLGDRHDDPKLISTIDKATKNEVEYQYERGFSAVRSDTISPDDSQALEDLVFRESRLKKWVQSALYLNVAETGAPRHMSHLVASVAAAIAMSVAILAAFFADRLYANYSIPWALLIVGSYILKDRVKEILRGALARSFPVAFSDRTRILKDPATGQRVGNVRLTIRRVPVTDHAFSGEWGRRNHPLIQTEPHRAFVISMQTRLHGRTLLSSHRRVGGVVDITRVRLEKWLRDLDSPIKRIRLFVRRKPVETTAPRIYRAHVSVRFSRIDEPGDTVQYWTLVLSRDGVVRIDRDWDSPMRPTTGPSRGGPFIDIDE